MSNLTPEALHAVTEIAARHGFSTDAVLSMLDSLARGGGAQAQFSHPEFGGMGQWSRGGMIMIGDMFNQGLKYRVDALCGDLGSWLAQQPLNAAPRQAYSSQSQSQGGGGYFQNSSSAWPEELGQPSSVGAQNDMSYAFFPAARRLAIRRGSELQVYDTGDHAFNGFSQQQGGGQSLTFNSQRGTVRVSDLPLASNSPASEAQGAPAAEPAHSVAAERPMSMTPPAPPPANPRLRAFIGRCS